MKRLGIILLVLALIVGCGPSKHLPGQDIRTVYHYVDSVRWVDSTIYVQVPVERIVDVVPAYDTLKLETSLAVALSYVDTLTHTLKGTIENRQDSIRTIVKLKDRKVVEYRDSIVTKEVPYPVVEVREVVPRWCWFLLALDVLLVIGIAVRLYLRLK